MQGSLLWNKLLSSKVSSIFSLVKDRLCPNPGALIFLTKLLYFGKDYQSF